jgi:FMN-dependent oxidoreductase (nitrilotriacetate monooxygenase family)
MSTARRLHLGAFMRPVSIHTAWWRYPGSEPDTNFNFKRLARLAQTLERGCFDAFFMADHLAVLNMPLDALKRSATVSSFDPLTLLPALAVVTERIGLIATASTTYNEPYHVARKFASLDHLSGGRAGWNVVTSGNPTEALNFGLEEHVQHAVRYRRAREFFDVVTGLWDSWADDAFIRDQASGVFFDPERMHVLDHKGEFLKVRGPLNVARPIQGWPVIVQAGASDAGRQLAAETAEVIFAASTDLNDARAFYHDVKQRAEKAGRRPEHLKVLPGALVVVGDTFEEARAKHARLDSLVHYDSAIASLSVALGTDGKRDHLNVRQLAQRVGGFAGLTFVGTGASIADEMEHWLASDGCDGFNVMFPFLPAGVDDFVAKVVPEQQRRGIFRERYEGGTLREHLGLPRPENPNFSATRKPQP